MKHSNIHIHSTFSDGIHTPEEMIGKAKELSFVSLGFSEHSQTAFDSSYHSMEEENYSLYAETIRSLQKREEELEILCGIEKDSFSSVPTELFDYVIGSVHYLCSGGDYYPVDKNPKWQQKWIMDHGKGDPMEMAKRYFEAVVLHAQKESFPIQGHFDLITKFGFFDNLGESYEALALEALREVMKCVPYLELNTGAISRGWRTKPYPALFLLEEIRRLGGKVMINGDSHSADSLNCHFEDCVALLRSTGFPSFWQLRKGGFTEVSLL
jgi:histidinol-phosphatase (PHP family)